jgi:hypothetical protein
MSGFYLLDVPEFAPLAEAALRTGKAREERKIGCYRSIVFDDQLDIDRADTGLTEAVWYGCLTAGLDGKIARFDSQRLTLVATNDPILPHP